MEKVQFSFENIINLFKKRIALSTGRTLLEKCERFDMIYQDHIINSSKESPIPFDNSYTLVFSTPNRNKGTLTIFELRSQITEVEIQIFYSRFSFKEQFSKDYAEALTAFSNQYHGNNIPNLFLEKTYHFEDVTTLGYLSKSSLLFYNILTLRFGNRNIWDRFFPRISR